MGDGLFSNLNSGAKALTSSGFLFVFFFCFFQVFSYKGKSDNFQTELNFSCIS